MFGCAPSTRYLCPLSNALHLVAVGPEVLAARAVLPEILAKAPSSPPVKDTPFTAFGTPYTTLSTPPFSRISIPELSPHPPFLARPRPLRPPPILGHVQVALVPRHALRVRGDAHADEELGTAELLRQLLARPYKWV